MAVTPFFALILPPHSALIGSLDYLPRYSIRS